MTIESRNTALIEIDVQNDFCPAYRDRPAGALAVNHGDEVTAPLNAVAAELARKGGRVAATADWHPRGHISFASAHAGKKAGDSLDPGDGETQILWPDHCVQGSAGAAFHDDLDLNPVNFIIRKGFRPRMDSYSAFFENDRKTPTGLEGCLRGLGIRTLVMGGLATDYCVLYSALDAARLGFRTLVLSDAVRGVGFPEGSVEKALRLMEDAGIELLSSETLLTRILA